MGGVHVNDYLFFIALRGKIDLNLAIITTDRGYLNIQMTARFIFSWHLLLFEWDIRSIITLNRRICLKFLLFSQYFISTLTVKQLIKCNLNGHFLLIFQIFIHEHVLLLVQIQILMLQGINFLLFLALFFQTRQRIKSMYKYMLLRFKISLHLKITFVNTLLLLQISYL